MMMMKRKKYACAVRLTGVRQKRGWSLFEDKSSAIHALAPLR